MLFAILFWFISYAGIEALFTLYCVNYLKLGVSDGSRLLGQLSLLFVVFALPAGYLGRSFGRKRTIMVGIVIMAAAVASLFFVPVLSLTHVLTKLPVLGQVPIVGLILMVTGIAWALININSLPMVVDMTDEVHNGTFTGLYYLFSTLAAIIGPIMYGWIIQLNNSRYDLVMLVSPIFLVAAFICMIFVKRGEPKQIEPTA
jgi:MFS family permease